MSVVAPLLADFAENMRNITSYQQACPEGQYGKKQETKIDGLRLIVCRKNNQQGSRPSSVLAIDA